MHSFAAFAQIPSEVEVELPEDMAAKRARTESMAVSFEAVDTATMTVKAIETKNSPIYLVVSEHQEVQIILTPDQPCTVLRGFDMIGEKEKTAFNSKEADAMGNRLSVYVTLEEEQAKFLDQASERIRAEMDLEEGVEWYPLIPKSTKYASPAVGIKVALGGEDRNLTALKIKQGSDTMTAGKGWSFLQEMAGTQRLRANAFTGAEVKAVVKFRPWKNGSKAGVELLATQLALKVVERKFVDLLSDW